MARGSGWTRWGCVATAICLCGCGATEQAGSAPEPTAAAPLERRPELQPAERVSPEAPVPEAPPSRPLRGSAAESIVVRVCARRDPGRLDGGGTVTFQPIADLSYARLNEAAAGTPLTFRVPAFAEVPAEAGWVSVEGGGAIVAMAFAEQLSAMALAAFADVSSDPASPVAARLEELRKLGCWITVAGKTAFWVRHAKRGERHETIASLSADVYFTGVDLHGAMTLLGPEEDVEGRLLVAIRAQATETETSPSLEQALKADRKVVEAVLAKVIRKVLENPRVEPALVDFVTGAAPGTPEPSADG